MTVIKWYCNSFYLRIFNPIETCCDNESYVNKLNELQSNTYSKLFIQKLKEYETYLELINIFPKNFHLIHVKRHQHDFKNTAELTIPQILKIEADIIATSKAKPPLNISLPSVPFAFYVHQKYINLNFQQRIRESFFINEANTFLQSKYN